MANNLMQLYTNAAAVASGIFFWAAFLVFGFIARRYSVVFKKATFHTTLMIAPSGILFYSLLIMIKSSPLVKSAAVNSVIQTAACGLLFLSAVLCFAGILKFNSLLSELLKYKEQK
jgi:hypothetical protein